jgi:hypothetical protein
MVYNYNIDMLVSLLVIMPIFCAVLLTGPSNMVHRAKNPNKKSYRWGYFQGIFAITSFFAFIGIALIYNLHYSEYMEPHDWVMVKVFGAYLFMCFLLGIGVAMKRMSHFVLLTLLTFNPLLYVINFIYIYKRRKEYI